MGFCAGGGVIVVPVCAVCTGGSGSFVPCELSAVGCSVLAGCSGCGVSLPPTLAILWLDPGETR